MKITEQFANLIVNGFESGNTGDKVALGLSSPLWFAGLIVSGTVEGVVDIAKGAVDAVGNVAGTAVDGTVDVAKGAVDAVGNVAGTTGEVTLKKIKKLEEIRGTTPIGEIMVKFEGETYDYRTAIALFIKLNETDKKEEAKTLYNQILESVISAKK